MDCMIAIVEAVIGEVLTGVTLRKKVSLARLQEKAALARQLPYVGLQVCVVLELLSKEAQFERGPGVLEGPTEKIPKGGKDEEDSFLCHGRSLFLHV